MLADGFPIALAGRLQGRIILRTAGSDLIDPLCAEASRSGISIVFFGSSFASLVGAANGSRRFIVACRSLVCTPRHRLYDVLSADADEGIEFIRSSGAKFCFVALGASKQELFADRRAREIERVLFVCIGAGLDFLTGH